VGVDAFVDVAVVSLVVIVDEGDMAASVLIFIVVLACGINLTDFLSLKSLSDFE